MLLLNLESETWNFAKWWLENVASNCGVNETNSQILVGYWALKENFLEIKGISREHERKWH